MVGLRGGRHVPAGGADTQGPDALGVDGVAGGQVRDSRPDILAALERVFQEAGLALALALGGGVERQCGVALVSESLGVGAGGLLLDAPPGWPTMIAGSRSPSCPPGVKSNPARVMPLLGNETLVVFIEMAPWYLA